jgi:hypothetical protein
VKPGKTRSTKTEKTNELVDKNVYIYIYIYISVCWSIIKGINLVARLRFERVRNLKMRDFE